MCPISNPPDITCCTDHPPHIVIQSARLPALPGGGPDGQGMKWSEGSFFEETDSSLHSVSFRMNCVIIQALLDNFHQKVVRFFQLQKPVGVICWLLLL